jgi:uncharacterized protein DUF1508
VAAARFQLQVIRPPGGATAGHVTWRLLATNNRDIGRSATMYPDAAACRAAVGGLRAESAALQAVTVRSGPSAWSWRIVLGDAVVAVSSRDYQRRVHADYAGTVALGLIPKAGVADVDVAVGRGWPQFGTEGVT